MIAEYGLVPETEAPGEAPRPPWAEETVALRKPAGSDPDRARRLELISRRQRRARAMRLTRFALAVVALVAAVTLIGTEADGGRQEVLGTLVPSRTQQRLAAARALPYVARRHAVRTHPQKTRAHTGTRRASARRGSPDAQRTPASELAAREAPESTAAPDDVPTYEAAPSPDPAPTGAPEPEAQAPSSPSQSGGQGEFGFEH